MVSCILLFAISIAFPHLLFTTLFKQTSHFFTSIFLHVFYLFIFVLFFHYLFYCFYLFFCLLYKLVDIAVWFLWRSVRFLEHCYSLSAYV